MIIRHNISALNLNNNLSLNRSSQAKALEKLSSGLRINRAGDDAAGLSISEKMRTAIRGLSMSQKNVQDGISLIQVAEGGLNEVHGCLQRVNELLTQSSNGTYQDSDRGNIQDEIDSLLKEIDHISQGTKFNNIALLDGSCSGGTISIAEKNKFISWLNGTWLNDAGTKVTGATGWTFAAGTKLDVEFKKVSGSSAVASMSGYWGGTDFKLTINTDYLQNGIVYNGTDGPDCGGIPADRLITHEMTHGLMFANTNSSSQPPFWVIEGLAEAVHGASDIRYQLQEKGFDTTFANVAADIASFDFANSSGDNKSYSVGYLATSYVFTQMGGANFKAAMGELKTGGKTFEQAILDNGGTSLSQMTSDFKSQAATAIGTSSAAFDTFLKTKCGIDLTDGKADPLVGGDATSSDVVPNGGTAVAPIGTVTNVAINGVNVSVNWAAGSSAASDGVIFQVGDTSTQTVTLSIDEMTTTALGVDKISAKTQTDAQKSIKMCKDAINAVSASRSNLGAFQNRLEHTMANLQMTEENTVSSESRIRDTDMANQMMNLVKRNVLVQASEALFAQVSQNPSKVLQLLQ